MRRERERGREVQGYIEGNWLSLSLLTCLPPSALLCWKFAAVKNRDAFFCACCLYKRCKNKRNKAFQVEVKCLVEMQQKQNQSKTNLKWQATQQNFRLHSFKIWTVCFQAFLPNRLLLNFFHTTLKRYELKSFLILAQVFSYPSIFLAKLDFEKPFSHFFKN